jgi:hypothetical protein
MDSTLFFIEVHLAMSQPTPPKVLTFPYPTDLPGDVLGPASTAMMHLHQLAQKHSDLAATAAGRKEKLLAETHLCASKAAHAAMEYLAGAEFDSVVHADGYSFEVNADGNIVAMLDHMPQGYAPPLECDHTQVLNIVRQAHNQHVPLQ